MNWKKAVLYGLALWVLMFVIISIFVAFKIYENVVMQVIGALIGGGISYFFVRKIGASSMLNALMYGASFIIVGLVLDFVVTKRFNDQIFGMWSLWLGYGLVFLTPILTVKKNMPTQAQVS